MTRCSETGIKIAKAPKELAKLTQLTGLNLQITQVTTAGVAQLKKALPKCKIYHNATK